MQNPWDSGEPAQAEQRVPGMSAAELSARMQAGITVSKDPNQAPPIVRSWAANLALIGAACSALFGLWNVYSHWGSPLSEKLGFLVIMGILAGGLLYHREMLLRGMPKAWFFQIFLSMVGLILIPVGTVISLYVLSQWFRRDVREWFDW